MAFVGVTLKVTLNTGISAVKIKYTIDGTNYSEESLSNGGTVTVLQSSTAYVTGFTFSTGYGHPVACQGSSSWSMTSKFGTFLDDTLVMGTSEKNFAFTPTEMYYMKMTKGTGVDAFTLKYYQNSSTQKTATCKVTDTSASFYFNKGTTVSLSSVTPSSGYDYPVTVKNLSANGTYSMASSSSTKWSFDGSSSPSSSGYQISAEETAKYYLTVKYDANGGSGSPATHIEYGYSSSVTFNLSSTTPTPPTGYDFAGWKYSGTTYSSGASVTLTGSTTSGSKIYTFTAQWTAKSYLITFNQQNGSGGTSSIYASYGSTIPDITTPSRTGYTFGGYFTSANGGGTQYYDEDGNGLVIWSRTSGITLYAYWIAKEYIANIKFTSAGSPTNMPTNYTETGNSTSFQIQLPSTPPSRSGYTFGGWNKGTLTYAAGANATVEASESGTTNTFTAIWTANTYTITFDKQGGSSGTPSTTATYGQTVPDIAPPTSTTHDFQGYYDSIKDDATQYYDSSGTGLVTYTKLSNITLYARWKEKTEFIAKIIFDANGGSNPPTNDTLYGSSATLSYTITSQQPTPPTGYKFAGWKYRTEVKQARDVVDVYAAPEGYDNTFVAQWTALQYTVTLNNQGGSPSSSTVQATYGLTIPTITSLPTQTGYTFQGYYTEKDNPNSTQYYDSNGKGLKIYNTAGTMTLYARWAPSTYTVTLNANGGSGGKSSVTATYKQPLPALTTSELPTLSGYTFNGYYTSTNGGACYYNSDGSSTGEKWNNAGTGTLYARWTANSVYSITVNFYTDGGTFVDSIYKEGTVSNSTNFNITMPSAPSRDGYTFYKWEYNGTQYDAGETVNNVFTGKVGGKSYDVYAVWKANAYYVKIIFDPNGGSYSIGEQTYEGTVDGVLVTLPTEIPVHPNGLTFQGWAYNGQGYVAGWQYDLFEGAQNASDAEYTLTAIWAKYVANFTFNPGEYPNVTNMPVNYFVESETNLINTTIPFDEPLNPGYTFQYWECSDGNQYYVGQEAQFTLYESNVELILTAVYIPNTYTITFDYTGEQIEVLYGSALPYITPPTQQGFVFGGYYTVADGVQTFWYDAYGNGINLWNIPYDTVLYAYWIQSGTIAEDGGVYINGMYYIPYIYYNGGWCQAKAHVYTFGWTMTKKQIQ